MRVFGWAREHCGARFALWENVPGAFSSHKGADFALVVGAMAGCDDVSVPAHGWGSEGCAVGDHGMVEWAVLDAQWFGLAQRRKRVFALLDTGDWARRPPILLEREGLRGNSPPRRTQGEGATHAVAHSLTAGGFDASEDGTGRGTPLVAVERGSALAFALRGREGGAMPEVQGDQAGALRAASGGSTRSYVAFPINPNAFRGEGVALRLVQMLRGECVCATLASA